MTANSGIAYLLLESGQPIPEQQRKQGGFALSFHALDINLPATRESRPSEEASPIAPSPLLAFLSSKRVLAVTLTVLLFTFITAGMLAWWDAADMYHKRFDSRSPQGPHEDYVVFYSAGRLIREHRAYGLYNISTIADTEVRSMGRAVGGTGVLAFFNPPFVAAAFALAVVDIVGVLPSGFAQSAREDFLAGICCGEGRIGVHLREVEARHELAQVAQSGEHLVVVGMPA